MAVELAATVVGIVLPYVKKGAKALAEELRKSASDEAAEQGTKLAGRLWERIKGALGSDDERGAVEQFERRPEVSKALLEEVLAERLQADPDLAEELGALVRQEVQAGRDVVQLFGDGGILYMPGGTVSGVAAGYIGQVHGTPPSPGEKKDG